MFKFKYKITIDPKVIAILGPHLYGDTASIIAELVSNCYDADANNCWVTIKTGASPEIIIEDDGIGMTPKEVNKYFLDIGYDRRDERPKTAKGREVFGRKGIGKLAAFSLAKEIELYSLKDGQKAGCILNFDKITKEGNKKPEAIPEENIKFDNSKLSENGTGTRIVLRNIQKNINTTYYHLVNRIIRNFEMDFDKFKIYLIKNNEKPRKIDYAELDFFEKMDVIITLGDEYKEKSEIVRKNDIPEKYKETYSYGEDLKSQESKQERFPIIPRRIKVLGKTGEYKEVEFVYKGWIGSIASKGMLRGLIYTEGASKEEIANISVTDNRITLYSRKRIGEYDVLPRVQTDTIYDAYVIGEIQIDIFEDDELVDMAISNRRGYEDTDERYKALMDDLKSFVNFIAQRKAVFARRRREDEDKETADAIKKAFVEKTRTMDILMKKLDEEERNTVAEENLQLIRAAKLALSTRSVLISHDSENKEYGLFIMKIFELIGVDVDNNFIFTSHATTNVPHGEDIYEYLKDCFRYDIYVIFLFSRHFYDSNVCIAETGAAWATNKNHSNVTIDIDYEDIDKPINNAKQGFQIKDLKSIDKDEVLKFVKNVLNETGLASASDEVIKFAIEQAIEEFQGKLNTDSFYPKRKYQGHPLCDKPGCGNTMELEIEDKELYYECKTPECSKKTKAKIY